MIQNLEATSIRLGSVASVKINLTALPLSGYSLIVGEPLWKVTVSSGATHTPLPLA